MGSEMCIRDRKNTSHTSGYKPHFHKTTAFVATVGGFDDDDAHHQDSSHQESTDFHEVESSHDVDEGLYIPNYLEEAIPDDPALQIKVARALRVQEMETRRCFTCNKPGHLARDHWKFEEKNGTGPLQPRGPPLKNSTHERAGSKPSQPGQATPPVNPPK